MITQAATFFTSIFKNCSHNLVQTNTAKQHVLPQQSNHVVIRKKPWMFQQCNVEQHPIASKDDRNSSEGESYLEVKTSPNSWRSMSSSNSSSTSFSWLIRNVRSIQDACLTRISRKRWNNFGKVKLLIQAWVRRWMHTSQASHRGLNSNCNNKHWRQQNSWHHSCPFSIIMSEQCNLKDTKSRIEGVR